MSGRPVYIYALADPRSNEVRYIGKSVAPKRRLDEHCRHDQRRGSGSYCGRWIRELLAEGVRPVMQVLVEADEDTWEAIEREQIALYRARDARLTNLARGGEGGGAAGELSSQAKLTKEQAVEVVRLWNAGLRQKEISARLGISRSQAGGIINGRFRASETGVVPGPKQKLGHWREKYPERQLRGDEHPARLHPETRPRGERNGRAKNSDAGVDLARQMYQNGALQRELAAYFGVGQATISRWIRGEHRNPSS